MSHAVLIVGLRRDQDGNISGFKILNSYGNHSGDKGFLDVDINYYKNFLVHLYL
jgi:aminopeptidase C